MEEEWQPNSQNPSEQSTTNVNTGGGAVVQGNVNTEGGEFIARDKVTHVHLPEPRAFEMRRQVPKPIAGFMGREREIEELVGDLRSNAADVIGIYGMGGIGKTELAYAVAKRLENNYPIQLLVRMGAHSGNPLSAEQALQYCLTSLDPIAKLPEGLSQLQAAYRSTFRGKHVLIVLDDSRDDEHAAPFLPPPESCAILVTSRNSLASVLNSIELPLLAREESIELLCELCPRLTKTHADTLANVCSDLPLALRVAGSYLKIHRDMPPDGYVQELQESNRTQRLKVDEIFEVSYHALTPEQQAALRRLAIIPIGYDPAAVYVVINASHEVLSDLVANHLVIFNPEAQRYRLHDLTREFLISKHALSKNESDEMSERARRYLTRIFLKTLAARLRGDKTALRNNSFVWMEQEFTSNDYEAWFTKATRNRGLLLKVFRFLLGLNKHLNEKTS